jgi:hypothetical protein
MMTTQLLRNTLAAPRTLFLSVIASMIFSASCGSNPSQWFEDSKEKDPKKTSPEKTLVVGAWKGIFEERDTDGSLKDPVTVEMTLSARGQFQLRFPDKPDVFVTGSYQEFSSRQTLLLNIADSTFSLVGAPGRMVSMGYRVEGKELSLTSPGGDYTMASLDSSSNETALSGLAGTWSCRESASVRWSLAINKDESHFEAVISAPESRPVRLEGRVALRGDGYLLTTQHASNSTLKGYRLEGQLLSPKRLRLSAFSSDVSRSLTCQRTGK